MEGNSAEEEGNLKIDIKEYEDGSLAHQMITRMSQINIPVSPSKSTVGQSPCIFKFPDRFKDKNGKSSEPQMVSIGPYHHGYIDDQMMKKLKWQCLKYLLKRNEPNLNCYIDGIRPLEIETRECYSEKIDLSTDEFLEMMVLDGCFILELLRFTYSVRWGALLTKKNPDCEGHPLARMEWGILPKIYGDLLFLDNQIPLFVLEKLFEISKMTFEGTDPILSCIVVNIFSKILGIQCPKDEYYSRFREFKLLHLLHIVRLIFTPFGFELGSDQPQEFPLQYRWRPLDTIPSISKLRRAGIKVKKREKDNFLEVKFLRGGVIEMPIIILNDLMCSFLVNCVAFEQCHSMSSKHFSVYALFLDCLVNTAGDVEYLCDHGVIENYIETDVAASFINDLGKGLTFNCDYFPFFYLCYCVNEYYQNRLHRHWTSFKGEYFDKPWLCISVFGGVVLLVLSFLQTYYTIHPKH
jgi:hypothetical protein